MSDHYFWKIIDTVIVDRDTFWPASSEYIRFLAPTRGSRIRLVH